MDGGASVQLAENSKKAMFIKQTEKDFKVIIYILFKVVDAMIHSKLHFSPSDESTMESMGLHRKEFKIATGSP